MLSRVTRDDLEIRGDDQELCAYWMKDLQQSFPGSSIVCRQLTDSTMNDARRWLSHSGSSNDESRACYEGDTSLGSEVMRSGALAGDPDVVVLAAEQRGGRGRRGSHWHSPQGGFWVTFGHRVELPLGRLSGLSLAVGVAVQAAVRECGARTILKWPNDLLTEDGGKLGGILVEVVSGTKSDSSPPSWVLIGIGVNLHREEGKREEDGKVCEGAGYSTLSRCLSGRIIKPTDFARILAPHYQKTIGRFFSEGFRGLKDAWLSGSYAIGTMIRARNPERSDEFLWGEFGGVEENGALVLRLGCGEMIAGRGGEGAVREIRIVSGEVFVGGELKA